MGEKKLNMRMEEKVFGMGKKYVVVDFLADWVLLTQRIDDEPLHSRGGVGAVERE